MQLTSDEQRLSWKCRVKRVADRLVSRYLGTLNAGTEGVGPCRQTVVALALSAPSRELIFAGHAASHAECHHQQQQSSHSLLRYRSIILQQPYSGGQA